MLTATYSPAHLGWLILFGGNPTRIHEGRGLYVDLEDLRADLRALGLTLGENKRGVRAITKENDR